MNLTLTKRFAVYVDWTSEENSRPFYVGKGNQARVNGDERRNQYHKNIAKKYGLRREIVFESDVEDEVLERETELIQEYRTYIGFENSFGANMTLGGEGRSGSYPSAETRQKMSEAQTLAWQNEERRQVASQTQQARWADENVRRKASEKYVEVWSDPELRKKMSNIIKDALANPETKRRRSESEKKKWKNLSSEAYERRRKRASEAAKRREEAKRIQKQLVEDTIHG